MIQYRGILQVWLKVAQGRAMIAEGVEWVSCAYLFPFFSLSLSLSLFEETDPVLDMITVISWSTSPLNRNLVY